MMRIFFENEYAVYSIEKNIVHIAYKPGIAINRTAAVQIVKDRIAFQEEQSYPILCDIRQLRKIDKPARDYLALEGSTLVKALAFMIDSPVTDAMIQFYIRTNHSSIPTASFYQKEKAIGFLQRFLSFLVLLGLFII
ncbi:hypothetical protein [Cytophaga sp. FL35]|uniref:DUF7793 family protein n=1 Tax=Cytophaga sp. FL35 TaxID=1904456 RepID=UPI001653D2EE|nr:hypothetical protein [Cytophaga sp. FL35]MBC7000467.1 hypothetical protein [Cytophaga sp. FL35]